MLAQKTVETQTDEDVRGVGSKVSFGGNLKAKTGGDVNLRGSELAAGGDVEALVRRAGLSHPARALLDPRWTGQLSRLEFSALYAEAAWALDAHAARQEGREPLTKQEFDLFCQCLITCRTLRDVIARATAFQTMLIPRMGRLELVEQGDVAEFRMTTLRTKRCRSLTI